MLVKNRIKKTGSGKYYQEYNTNQYLKYFTIERCFKISTQN